MRVGFVIQKTGDENMKKIIDVTVYELREILRNTKILLVLFFVVILYESILFPINEICNTTDYSIGVFEPFILICSRSTNTILIPILFILLISGFPYCMNSYFHIIRTGKRAWVYGEIQFIVLSSALFLMVLYVGCIIPVMNNLSFSNEWSSFMTNLSSNYPEIYKKNILLCLDPSYTLHGTPSSESLYSFAVMWLNLVILGTIVLLGSILGKKMFLLFVAIGETLIGGCSIYFTSSVKWVFPLTHTQYGLHFNELFSGNNFDVQYTFVYLGLIVLAEFIACRINIEKANFLKG